MSRRTTEPTLRAFLVQWFWMGYNEEGTRRKWIMENEAVIFGRECANSYVIHYGSGELRKVLKKHATRGGTITRTYTRWYERYGRDLPHKIEFNLVPRK